MRRSRTTRRTMAEDFQASHDASVAFFWAVADALRLPRLAEWLLRRREGE